MPMTNPAAAAHNALATIQRHRSSLIVTAVFAACSLGIFAVLATHPGLLGELLPHHYGDPTTLNAGWTWGGLGWETRGEPGVFVCDGRC